MYLISWTPYAWVSMYSAFSTEDFTNPLMSTVPSLFSCSSLWWTPLINIMANRPIKEKFKLMIGCIEPSEIREEEMEVHNNNENQINLLDK